MSGAPHSIGGGSRPLREEVRQGGKGRAPGRQRAIAGGRSVASEGPPGVWGGFIENSLPRGGEEELRHGGKLWMADILSFPGLLRNHGLVLPVSPRFPEPLQGQCPIPGPCRPTGGKDIIKREKRILFRTRHQGLDAAFCRGKAPPGFLFPPLALTGGEFGANPFS